MFFPATIAELAHAWALGVEVAYEDSRVVAGLGFAAEATIPAIVQTMTVNATGSRHGGSNCFKASWLITVSSARGETSTDIHTGSKSDTHDRGVV